METHCVVSIKCKIGMLNHTVYGTLCQGYDRSQSTGPVKQMIQFEQHIFAALIHKSGAISSTVHSLRRNYVRLQSQKQGPW